MKAYLLVYSTEASLKGLKTWDCILIGISLRLVMLGPQMSEV